MKVRVIDVVVVEVPVIVVAVDVVTVVDAPSGIDVVVVGSTVVDV